jgi:hypothetical protein
MFRQSLLESARDMLERERYAVVSCHVERPLDDRIWAAFSTLQRRRPAGFQIAALMRPPDEAAGEDFSLWVARARSAAAHGPLGHHTHWGRPSRARPENGDPAERVHQEAAWLRNEGLEATLFCGGGWYLDEDVARTLAELGYADCTATAFSPRYLDSGAPSLRAGQPCWLELQSGERLLELPTTHSLGMLLRASLHPGGLREPLVHAYFHDIDLLDRTRSAALRVGLGLLARRRIPFDLARIAKRAAAEELPVSRPFGR